MNALTCSSQRFAVIASPRTGSTLLVRSLDLSPDIFCAGEIFHAGPGIHHPEFQYPYKFLGSRKLARIRDQLIQGARVEHHLSEFYERAGRSASAVGFKLMANQAVAHPRVLPFLARHSVVRFYLYRKDVFATALSYYKVGSSRVDLQACKLEYSIVSPK